MKQFFTAHGKQMLGVVIVVLLAVVATVVFVTARHGRMSVTDDQKKMYDNAVNQQTVDYYSAVCTSVNNIDDVSHDYMTVQADTVGDDPDDIAKAYRDKAGAMLSTLKESSSRMSDVDNNAPTVYFVDGTKFDFHGAISPMTDALSRGSRELSDVVKSDDLSSHDQSVQSGATQRVTKVAMDTVSKSHESLTKVFTSAPLLSEATRHAVTNDSPCKELFNSDFAGDEGKKRVVHDLIEFQTVARTNYESVNSALNQVFAISDVGNVPTDVLRDGAIRAFDHVANTAQGEVDALRSWSITAPEGSPEFVASREAESFRSHGVKVGEDTSAWSRGVADRLRGVADGDSDGVADVIKDISPEVRDQMVSQTRFVTEVFTQLSLPTKPTQEGADKSVHEANPMLDAPVVPSVVDGFSVVFDSHHEIVSSLQSMNDVLSSAEGKSVESVRSQLVSKLGTIAENAQNGASRSRSWDNREKVGTPQFEASETLREPISRYADGADEIAQWARNASTRIQNSSARGFNDVVKSSMSELSSVQASEGQPAFDVFYMARATRGQTVNELTKHVQSATSSDND